MSSGKWDEPCRSARGGTVPDDAEWPLFVSKVIPGVYIMAPDAATAARVDADLARGEREAANDLQR